MKTLLFVAAMAFTTLTASANKESAKNKVAVSISRSFESEFGNVENVAWSPAANNMYRAEFSKDGENVNAFFTESGEFIAQTVELTKAELPAKIKAAIAKKTTDGIITEAIRLTNTKEEAYFVKVYVDGKSNIYKAFSSGSLLQVNL